MESSGADDIQPPGDLRADEEGRRRRRGAGLDEQKLPYLTLPWTIVTGIMAALYFVLCLTGMSLMLQDTGSLLGFEAVLIFLKFARTCFSVYCIMVVHSRHKQIMAEEDESRFQHSGRIYSAVKTDENPL
ncbi:hypothetical protein MSG28_004862 [Choristoneura fumiferana]|uniref:Uncharacterized protein n=1 Tax=Choristoneura fumiferana TaxID=7141 RepID=A0ACC0K7W8_CHOFU|nr:hypothetical protein MSG28_004862 [Choristoneura fumiferana]